MADQGVLNLNEGLVPAATTTDSLEGASETSSGSAGPQQSDVLLKDSPWGMFGQRHWILLALFVGMCCQFLQRSSMVRAYTACQSKKDRALTCF